jgi:hypothetical protein
MSYHFPEPTEDTKREHRARWFVYTGQVVDGARERIPWQSAMRGFWPGYEVTCSCGWESRTGGGLRRYVRDLLDEHRSDAQYAKDTAAPAAN